MGEKAFITGTQVAAQLTGRPDASVARRARRRPCEVPSCGREVMVFPVEGPEDLPGIHPDLIGPALRPGERLRSLVYAPIWDGDEAAFGIRGERASHSVAVTDGRFIISRSFHRKGRPPDVQAVPLDQVLVVETGSSLLPGWFAVRFADSDELRTESFLYEATYGREHFAALVHEYRAAAGPTRPLPATQPRPAWSELWRRVSPRQAGRLRPVVCQDETLLAFTTSSQTWGTRRSLFGSVPACAAEEGVLVVTDHGFMHIVNEPDLRPDLWSFGINVCCIPHGALRSCAIVERVSVGVSLRCLRLELGRGSVSWRVDVPFDAQCATSAVRLTQMWKGWESHE